MGRRGLSLIEAAAAAAILALISTGVFGVFWQGFQEARKSRMFTAAQNLSRGFLEQYSDWGSLPANGSYSLGSSILNNITYSATLTIGDGPINPAQLKRLDITVSWIDGTIPRNVAVTTLKADY